MARALVASLFLGLAVTPAAAAQILMPGPRSAWVREDEPRPAAHLIGSVKPGRVVELRSRPFGPVIARVGARTPFGSQRTLGVVRTQRGRWLAVTEAGVGGNRIVWADAKARTMHYARTRIALSVDLSKRTLTVRRDGAVVRRFSVAVGSSQSPTPTGRFAVTDKLRGHAYSATYGCCILALSAIQPNLPAGWSGGNRIAIHGTLTAEFGRAVSAGCMHARDSDLQYLMRAVRLGTPVVIRP